MSTNTTSSLATVADITGKVWAVAEDGTRHLLQKGDAVYEGEAVLTESGALVVLKAENGAERKITESKEVVLSGGLFEQRETVFSLDLRGLIAATDGAPDAAPPQVPAAAIPAPASSPSVQQLSQGGSLGGLQTDHGFISVERVEESVTTLPYQLWSFTGSYNSASQFRTSGSDLLLEGRGTVDERLSMLLEPLPFFVSDPLPAPQVAPAFHGVTLRPNAGTTIAIPGNGSVYEAGLSAGTNPGNARIFSGTFMITAPDGLATIKVEGAKYGSLVITGTTPDPATGGWVVSYTYTLTVNTLHSGSSNAMLDSLLVTVTDVDGDSSTAPLVLTIVDDVPTARPDADSVIRNTVLPVTGNVVSGHNPTTEDDTIGADNSPINPVTGVRSGSNTGTPATSNVGLAVAGSYGSLTIGADGAYSYTLDNTNPAIVALTTGNTLIDTFVYTITDADGDQSTTTLTMTINGSTGALVYGAVQEDALNNFAGGNGSTGYRTGEGAKTTIATGTLTTLVSAGTVGTPTFSLQTGTLAALGLTSKGQLLSYVVAGDTLTASNGAGRNVFTLVLSGANNQTYTFTLLDQFDNSSGSGDLALLEVNLSSAIKAVDGGGNAAMVDGVFKITVENDVPVASVATLLSDTVYEDDLTIGTGNLSTGNPDEVAPKLKTVSGFLNTLFTSGADETTAVANSLNYSLQAVPVGGLDPVLQTAGSVDVKSKSSTVRYTVNGTGLIVTGYADDNGDGKYVAADDRIVFTLTITDAATGAYTFALNDQLDHANLTDIGLLALNLAPALVATDKDGDRASRSTGFTINVENDVPENTASSVTRAVHEDALTLANSNNNSVGYSTGEGTKTTVATGSIATLVAVGADEPVTFSLQVGNLAVLGLKSKGVDLSYAVVDNTLTASAGGRNIFTLVLSGGLVSTTVNATYTFTLLDQIDHTAGSGDNANLTINLSSAIKATDKDGDSITVDNGFTVTVENDVPVASGSILSPTVYEDDLTTASGNLSTGNPDLPAPKLKTASGVLTTLFLSGADETTAVANSLIYSLQAVNESDGKNSILKTTGGGAVTSLGSTVRYKVDGTGLILTGYADDGGVSGTYDGTDRMIFTLTITAAGAYTFALNAQLDHVDLGDTGLLALNLSPALVATDFDGDQATLATGFTVNVENDVPIAVNDANEIPYEGGAKIGSTGGTLTKATLLLNDSPGADSTIRISAITYVNGVGVTVTGLPVPDGGSTGVLTTLLGSLQVWSNGNWEYTPAATLSHTTDPLSEDLTYTIIDKDGDMATAKKSFYVYDTSPTISAPTRIIADQGTLPVTVVGHLPAVLVADAFNVLFNVPAPPAGLASGGNIIAYSFPSTTQLVATIHSGADEVFRITLDNTTPTNATYTFVQSRVIDHVAGAPVLDLPFKYKVTETLAPATENTLLNGSTALFHVSVNGGTVLTPAPATDDTLLFTGATPAALVDMGAGGFDTLLFTSGISLADLHDLNGKVSNLEVIDLSVDGVNSLGTVATPLLTADVNAIGSSNSLYVLGTSGDHVILGGSFVKQAASSTYSYNSGSHVMDVYKDAALSTVYVEQGVSVP